MTMSAVDFLDQWFETDVLKATMSASGIIGTFLGVRSPGTAYVLLHHYMGEIDGAFRSWGLCRGGTGAISNALGAAAQEAGVEIRTSTAVDKILVRGNKAHGVVLANGDEIQANLVVSSVDPRLTFVRMMEPGLLPDDFVADIHRYKFRGSSGKVNLALDALPDFPVPAHTSASDPHAHLRGAVSISPSVDYMERAYDDAKYGRFSRRPYIDIVIPSLTDPSISPSGKHVMSCFVQYAPYHLKEGTWDDQRDAFGDTVVNTLSEFAPNLKNIILHRQVVTPLDLEREWGLSEGNIFQGELTLEQLFFLRPAPDGRSTRPRSNASTCAAPPRTPAAASWERPAGTQRSRSFRIPDADERCPDHRRRPQRAGGGVLPRESGASHDGARAAGRRRWRRADDGVASRVPRSGADALDRAPVERDRGGDGPADARRRVPAVERAGVRARRQRPRGGAAQRRAEHGGGAEGAQRQGRGR
jgi:hypothetical protein